MRKLPKRFHYIGLQFPGVIDLSRGVGFKVIPTRSKQGWVLQIIDPVTKRASVECLLERVGYG
jgi:hypothetical protein